MALRLGIAATGLETARDYRYAGVARVSFSLCEALVRLAGPDLAVVLFVLPSFEVPAAWTASGFVEVRRMGAGYTKWMVAFGGLAAMRARLDFLLSTSQIVPWYGPVPCGLVVHDLFPITHPEWYNAEQAANLRRMLPRSIRRCRLLFANSEDTRRDTLRLVGVPPERVRVIPLGPGNVLAPRDPASVSDDDLARLGVPFRRYLFTLSTLEPRKNLPRLFEAFALLAAQNPDLGLVVGGGKGWKTEGILERLEELGLSDRVRFLGYVEDADLPALFARCELYVCPSLTEGFGMPVLEAMLAGAPVATSTNGALLEVAGDAAACTFAPDDAAAMASAIQSALDRPERRAEWVARGFERAKRFTWTRAAEEILAAIREKP